VVRADGTDARIPAQRAGGSVSKEIGEVLEGHRRWVIVNGDGLQVMRELAKSVRRSQSIHVITDPPYSEDVHSRVQTGKRNALPDVVNASCRERRKVDLDFAPMTPAERRAFAALSTGVATRWVIMFSDAESAHDWRDSFIGRGLPRYFRTGAWWRLGGAPHFNGDGPAPGHEELLYFHATTPLGQKRRWNGGGKSAVYSCPIVANRKGQQGSRVHPAQKPIPLMLEILGDIVEPGDLVIDPYCGTAATGIAALRLGCRFIGVDIDQKNGWVEMARMGMKAATNSSTLRAARAGHQPLFPA
jgi:hypothetical protein